MSRAAPLLFAGAGLGVLLLGRGGEVLPVAGDSRAEADPDGPARIVVDYVDGADVGEIAALEAKLGVGLDWASAVSEDEALRAGTAADADSTLAALRQSPLVEVAEAEIRMESLGFPDDPLYAKQWNFERIGAARGWAAGAGKGVIVAVIDTGVSAYADLPAERLLPGRSFVAGTTSPADDNGHGTHVASTIAEATHNGIGAAGLAFGATILPLKVLGADGSGTSAHIAAAIDEAVDQGAQVINLSLGGGHSDVVVEAVAKARAAGVVVVAAAGNRGREGLGSPADASEAIGVSAVGPDDQLAPYSSWGAGVEIAAPGGDTRVADGGILQGVVRGGSTEYLPFQGTSMASPHVAASAAILFGAGAQSADEVERCLKRGAEAREAPLKYGAGRLDLAGALDELLLMRHGLRFAAGALLTRALAGFARMGGLASWGTAAAGGVVAGGLFFVPYLLGHLSPGGPLVQPMLSWPGPAWGGFPLWQSALLPFLVGFVLGPSARLGWLGLALSGGISASLLWGAATGATDVWWMQGGAELAWLSVNGTLALLAGMAVAGFQSMLKRVS